MDRVTTELGQLDEGALRHLAERLAPRLRPGDFLALKGDLGAGGGCGDFGLYFRNWMNDGVVAAPATRLRVTHSGLSPGAPR
jgi:hypothetical protein